MKQLPILLFILILFTLAANAQDQVYPQFHVNGNFQVGIPLEDFRDQLDDIGFGGGGLFLVQAGNTPLSAGVELSIMGYAIETARYDVRVGGFFKDYELQTSSNIFLGHFVLRFQPATSFPVKPYFDGMVGFKNLFTSTTLTDRDIGETLESGTDESDWAFSYGGAVGLQFTLSQNSGIVLDLRCAYLPGSNASYLTRKKETGTNPDYNDPIDAFEEKTSPTLLLLPQIGITFKGLFSKENDEDFDYDYD